MYIQILKEMFYEMVIKKNANLIPNYYHENFLLYTNEQIIDYTAFLKSHQEYYATSIEYDVTYDEAAFVEANEKVAARVWITTRKPNEPSKKIEVILITEFKDNKIYRLWELTYPDWSKLPSFKLDKTKSVFIETKNLIVYHPDTSDFEELCKLQSDPDVMRYVGTGVRSPEEVRDQLKKFIQHDLKHGFSLGSVYEKSTGEFVGRAGLIYLALDDTQEDIEVGYALQKKFWNKGYATELAKGLVKWGFMQLATNHLVAVIRPENEQSRRVLEKAGMRYIGRDTYRTHEVAKYIVYKKTIDDKDFALIPATGNDYTVIQNMARFYAYDISEHYGHQPGWELEEDGLYGTGLDFKQYLNVSDTFPFLIHYKGALAGFAIVDKRGSDDSIDFNMAQFFILRTYKSKGFGKYIAKMCFDMFKGTWEVMVMPENENAYRFWRNVIKEYTNNNFVEYTKTVAHFKNEKRNFFKFSSGKRV